jgi:hypothetical protein
VLAPDPLFRGIEDIRHAVPFLSSNWPTITERPIDEWSVFALLLPTHVSAFWDTFPPGWEAFPALTHLARTLVQDRTLIDAAEQRTPVATVAERIADRLSESLTEVSNVANHRPPTTA